MVYEGNRQVPPGPVYPELARRLGHKQAIDDDIGAWDFCIAK